MYKDLFKYFVQIFCTGHPSTRVYTETTSINIFGKKKLACYEWEPTKSILASAKYATYKNLQAKKKEQQQAAANEDAGD